MKKFVTLVALFSLGVATAAFAETREEVQNRLDNATLVLHQIMAAPDKGIPEEVLEHAKCVAVVPHMIKARLCVWRENGKGVATCRTADGWSAPAFFAITGGSWGLQIGVEGVDLVMIFQGDRGMQRLKRQVPAWSGRLRGSRTGGTPCHCRYRLEAEYRDPHLLARQRRLCRTHADRRRCSPR
jgi:lipid-binding SYLF domain-containing protein